VKLDTEGIRYIGIFERLTGASVKDCVVDENTGKIIMVVKNGDIGLAIGRGGCNINKVRQLIRKDMEVVEHSTDIREFIENLLRPAYVKSVEVLTKDNNKCCVHVKVLTRDKGIAIGKNGKNINKVKLLVKRNQNIDDVIIK
jgi:N utilization substance protein A